ncbi:MAG: glycosyltransferase family 2 protein [Caldilineaceae bacterium]
MAAAAAGERGPAISLIIPALNEAACLGPLLAEVPPDLAGEIIVVDNGSTDDTAAVARAAGAQVMVEPRRGYGAACRAGAMAARGDILVFMDGDGSFVPAECAALAAPLAAGRADLVLGTRMQRPLAPGAMPPHQRWGNQVVAGLLRMLYGVQVTDLGPYRAIRRELLVALAMQEMTYGWPVEMMVKTAQRGGVLAEVPVSYRPRTAGVSKVGGSVKGTVLATYRILRVTFRYAGNRAGNHTGEHGGD